MRFGWLQHGKAIDDIQAVTDWVSALLEYMSTGSEVSTASPRTSPLPFPILFPSSSSSDLILGVENGSEKNRKGFFAFDFFLETESEKCLMAYKISLDDHRFWVVLRAPRSYQRLSGEVCEIYQHLALGVCVTYQRLALEVCVICSD